MKKTLILDEQKLFENFVGMEGTIYELVDEFLGHQQEYLHDIENALLKKDMKSLRLKAHAIKGILLSFYAEPSINEALKLENLAAEGGSFADAAKLLASLRTQVGLLLPELERIRQNRGLHKLPS